MATHPVEYGPGGIAHEILDRMNMRSGSKRLLKAIDKARGIKRPRVRRKPERTVRSLYDVWQFTPSDNLIDDAAKLFGVSVEEIEGHSRKRLLVDARSIIAVILREREWSFPLIGLALDRDHTTIINLCERWEHRKQVPELQAAYAALRGGA